MKRDNLRKRELAKYVDGGRFSVRIIADVLQDKNKKADSHQLKKQR